MQLDLRQFQLKIESITRLRPLPDASLVEAYIKAFYLPESALEQWVQEHKVSATRKTIEFFVNVTDCRNTTLVNWLGSFRVSGRQAERAV